MHGDLLCSDDVAYQRFRRRVRNPLLKRLFLLRRLERRRALAADYRRRSGRATATKPDAIMDANQATVASYMARHHAPLLIHGHTHRPARHEFRLQGRPACRWVLAPWHDSRGEALRVSASGIEVEVVAN
jgi:UDP-2,3-diacylglucosamine hydrolase